MYKTYLVTGGAGFIGSNFIRYILKKYEDRINVINLDKLTYAGNLDNIREVEKYKNYKFIKGDICNKRLVYKIFENNSVDYVVNFAAESHVDRSIISADEFVLTNVLGTLNILDVSKKFWLNNDEYKKGVKFVQISTDEVYGSLPSGGYFTELSAINPHSPYSASKASADMLVKSYWDTHKMPINVTRCSNNYGPYQFPEKFIPLIISNSLLHKSIPVYGDGLNIRDWLYVEDHCSAIDLVINRGKFGEVYNIGGFNEKTNINVVKQIIDYLYEKKDNSINMSLVKYVNDRKGHDRRYAIDSTKISEELGWRPSVCFEEGLKNTIEWYLQNFDWVEKILNGEYKNYYENFYRLS